MRNPHHTSQANCWLAKKGLSKNQIADGRFGAKREDKKIRERGKILSQRNRGRQRYKKELGKRRQRKYGKRTLFSRSGGRERGKRRSMHFSTQVREKGNTAMMKKVLRRIHLFF